MIEIRNLARIPLPDNKDIIARILHMFTYNTRYGDTFFNYEYVTDDYGAYVLVPPNRRKLQTISTMLGLEIVDKRSEGAPPTPFVISDEYSPRDYQVQPIKELYEDVLINKASTLHAGCGTGKTIVLTHVAGLLGKSTLVLVDQSNLKSNWVDAFNLIWGKKLKNLTATTKVMSDCMITTFQALARNTTLRAKVARRFGTCLIDECHVATAPTFKEALFDLDNMYRLYCTATYRVKKLPKGVLEDLTAPITVQMVDREALIPDMHWVTTGTFWPSEDPMEYANKTLPYLSSHEGRNAIIMKCIERCVMRGRRTVVICIDQAQANLLATASAEIEGGKPQVYVGSTSKLEDERIKKAIETGEINLLFTCKKMDKGTDMPYLDAIINTKPNNSQNDTEQQSGRVRRKYEGKPTPLVIDLLDEGDLALTFANNRNKWYSQVDGKGYTMKNPELIKQRMDESKERRAAMFRSFSQKRY